MRATTLQAMGTSEATGPWLQLMTLQRAPSLM
jgi:hypothetical protein